MFWDVFDEPVRTKEDWIKDQKEYRGRDLDCKICNRPIEDATACIPCGHVFCYICIRDWYQAQPIPFPQEVPLCLVCKEKTWKYYPNIDRGEKFEMRPDEMEDLPRTFELENKLLYSMPWIDLEDPRYQITDTMTDSERREVANLRDEDTRPEVSIILGPETTMDTIVEINGKLLRITRTLFLHIKQFDDLTHTEMRRRIHFSRYEPFPNDPKVENTELSLFQYKLAKRDLDADPFSPLDLDGLINGSCLLEHGKRSEGPHVWDHLFAAEGDRGIRNIHYLREKGLYIIGEDEPPYSISVEWQADLWENAENDDPEPYLKEYTEDWQEKGRLQMVSFVKHRIAEFQNALAWLNRNNPKDHLDAVNREYTNILEPVKREDGWDPCVYCEGEHISGDCITPGDRIMDGIPETWKKSEIERNCNVM